MRSSAIIIILLVQVLFTSCLFLGKREETVVVANPEVTAGEQPEEPAEVPLDMETVNRLLLPGTYHGEDVGYDPLATSWLGLYHFQGRSVLRPVELIAKPAFDPILDGPGDSTALHFEVNKADSLLVGMFSGWSGQIKEAEIETYGIEFPKSLTPGMVIDLGSTCQLVTRPKGSTGITLLMERRDGTEESKVIHEAEELDDVAWQLLWAGDLNGDGQPDLILNVAHKYSYSHWALFLSNEDGPCSVRLVADFRFTAC